MTISGMDEFQEVCKQSLVSWYNWYMDIDKGGDGKKISFENVYVVWSCRELQNYKALLSTDVDGDGIYAEYTYNGDKQELYEDVYRKLTNLCIKNIENGSDKAQNEL